MNAIKLALLELLRFRGPLRRLVPVALLLIPLLYGALYLWSSWDPYGRLNKVPVAVVNSDRPVNAAGQHIDAGTQFVRQIKATGLFDWHFVPSADARRGLEDGRYYFTIEVPPDFSAKLATATRTTPQRAALRITKNDANGYIAGIMADTARAELQQQINAAAQAAYARALYGELEHVRERLQLASETSNQLVQGTDLGRQGISALGTGLGGVRDGAGQISQGVRGISAATTQLDNQMSAMSGLQQLPGAANALVDASNVTVSTLGGIKTGTGVARDRAAEGMAVQEQLGRTHPDLSADPVYQRALDNARKLATATVGADDDARRALSTAQDSRNRAVALLNTVEPVQNQVRSITAARDGLRSGTTQLTSGTDALTRGMDTLVAGNGVLQTGAGQLNDGSHRLSGLINDSLDKIPPTNPTQLAQAAHVLGSPSEITTVNLNPAKVYGRGLAPLFFAIALWVFGLFAYLLFKPVNLRALAGRTSAATIAVAGWLPAAGFGILSGLILFGAVEFGLGLDPAQPLATIGLITLGAITFVAIDHCLRTAFGTVGHVLSLVLFVVQLTACGGLYPMETAPTPFRAVHPYLPMTYLVDGLRVTISGGVTEHLVRDVMVLTGSLVIFLVLTTLAVQRQRTWSLGRLHPRFEF
jgi:putative membrane protein